MRVLVVGSDKIYAIENFYVKYLRALGAAVFQFSAQSIFYDYYGKSLLNKLLFRAGVATIYNTINNKFKQHVLDFKPDVIFIFKGMEILPESLEWAKAMKIKLVNYNPDNPFLFSGRGSGNSNVKNSINLYDLHFTYNFSIQKQFENKHSTNVEILPFGYDIREGLYEICKGQDEIAHACFLGNPDRERTDFILALVKEGIEFSVYGHGWDKFIADPLVRIHDAVYGDEQWKVLQRYRVQLNLMRVHNEDSHNMRTFEVPAIGGIMVAPDTHEHRQYFTDQEEVFLFCNITDCVAQIRMLLDLPKVKADAIRMAARQRSIQSGYSYADRAQQVLTAFEKLIHG